ncbi:DUF397 domain-containing protein [Streptomyces niveus]|uniref:DUF397 domain-containing protein n=1 Tax=Streptomyces niveus TaxID=193462 RepID=UPI00364B9F60
MTTTPDLTHAQWRKASLSESAQGCVEVAFIPGDLVAVRDSKDVAKPAHVYPVADWTTFQDRLRGLVSAELSRIVVTIAKNSVLLSDSRGAVDPTPFASADSEWEKLFEVIYFGMWT